MTCPQHDVSPRVERGCAALQEYFLEVDGSCDRILNQLKELEESTHAKAEEAFQSLGEELRQVAAEREEVLVAVLAGCRPLVDERHKQVEELLEKVAAKVCVLLIDFLCICILAVNFQHSPFKLAQEETSPAG